MKKPTADKDSDEYRQRRERNNLAVKKSRMRSKQKAQDTQQRVNELKEENERLEAKIKLLSKELSVLKDLFLEHAHNLADNVQPPPGGVNAVASPPVPNHNNNNGNNNNNHSQWEDRMFSEGVGVSIFPGNVWNAEILHQTLRRFNTRTYKKIHFVYILSSL